MTTTTSRSGPTTPLPAVDVLVIGGGAAGLAGATTLARARQSVLVVDAGSPRNAPADGVHSFLGHEGRSPAELLALGRRELASYGGRIVEGCAVTARQEADSTVEVALEDGRRLRARRLLVTTGLRDELPDVPGLDARFGRDVLHCPFCHGWEVRDRRVVVLASSPAGVHRGLLWRQWTDDVTLIDQGGLAAAGDDLDPLAARGVGVLRGPAIGLAIEDDILTGVRLADGRVVPCDALVAHERMVARSPVLDALGIHAEPIEAFGVDIGEVYPSDATGATSVPGVWLAGNVTDPMAQVITAAAAGVRAGAAIIADVVAEQTARAVSRQAG
ncbi:NAD(P)/FAD-dependent oxidoreductase [Euzebya rosea]|uniref:NAD(P)/FAD-dependent oxidoreductase n=1 Tax=Euzebya rosea TaxID=2052804 RepID=UPI000D3E1CD9|nr:NAD(P)/FAD-dependent oxidoreductase [Euzebya rosea]